MSTRRDSTRTAPTQSPEGQYASAERKHSNDRRGWLQVLSALAVLVTAVKAIRDLRRKGWEEACFDLLGGAIAAALFFVARDQRTIMQSQIDFTQRLADAAASNTRTHPLSDAVIGRLSDALRASGAKTISLGCQPNTASLCLDLRSAVRRSSIQMTAYQIGNMWGSSEHAVVVIAGVLARDDAARMIASALNREGIDAVAIPFDASYKPGALDTPMPDVRISGWHY